MNAVVVEFYILDHSVSAIRCDAVDEGDDAFTPLADLDVLRMSSRLHRCLRRRFGFVDCVTIGIGLDGEADDAMYWNDHRLAHLIYEIVSIGGTVAGGMGGGRVVDGLWLHPKVEELGVRQDIEQVLNGQRERIEMDRPVEPTAI